VRLYYVDFTYRLEKCGSSQIILAEQVAKNGEQACEKAEADQVSDLAFAADLVKERADAQGEIARSLVGQKERASYIERTDEEI